MNYTIEYVVENYKEIIEKAKTDIEERWYVLDCFSDFVECTTIDFVVTHHAELKALAEADLGGWHNLAPGVPENIDRLIEAGYDEEEVLKVAAMEICNRLSYDETCKLSKASRCGSFCDTLANLCPDIKPEYREKLHELIYLPDIDD